MVKRLPRFSPVLNGLGLVLLWAQPGWSHGAIATVTQTFLVEASYSSGQPMSLAQVAVYSPDNPDEPWTLGQTNEQGEFEFSPDSDGRWDVVIRQAGHGTTVSVPVQTQAVAAPAPTTGKTTAAIVSEPSANPVQRWVRA